MPFKPTFVINDPHDFHLVSRSKLPLMMAFSAFFVVLSIVFYWHSVSVSFFVGLFVHGALTLFVTVLISWLTMIVWESGFNFHTVTVRRGLRLGVVLFIVSEIMFFFSFFWAFFHYSVSPSIEVGYVWPLVEMQVVNVWDLPLTNTILLLSSGVTITFAHHAIRSSAYGSKDNTFAIHLVATIVLGITFLFCQWVEYTYGLRFEWDDHVNASIFFIATGFHGFHVLLGTLGLLFCLVRDFVTLHDYKEKTVLLFAIYNLVTNKDLQHADLSHIAAFVRRFRFTDTEHIGFEAALWYWHFVDVVWLFLFCTVYWWGSGLAPQI